MVEVTKSNFEEMLPSIGAAIKGSSFIAIDTEFTGLNLGAADTARLFDDLEERYQKYRTRATNFIPCQIGLSMFFKNENTNRYSVETYVFFIRPHMFGSSDRRFVFQASCVDFLSKYDFDFNKFFHEGIPYINEDQEKQAQKEIENGTISYPHQKARDLNEVRCLDMKISNNLLKPLQDKSEPIKKSVAQEQIKMKPHFFFSRDESEPAYFQLVELRHKYPTCWAYLEEDKIRVEVVTPDQRLELEKDSAEEEEKLMNFYLGFTQVFRLLKDAKKPIVGHNLLMDLLLFYHNFHKDLPSTYEEFKKELHSIFPVIFDTRHIWMNVRRFYNFRSVPKQCALFDLYHTFKNPTDDLSTLYSPDVVLLNCKKYNTEKLPHESGYDAYICGWVFVKISHLLAMKKITNLELVQPLTFKQHLDALVPFVNKVNIGRSRFRYLNLDGEDNLKNIPGFLHIRSRKFGKVLAEKELSSLFEKYGLVEFQLYGNKRRAMIAVGTFGAHKEILKGFENHSDYIVSEYRALRHSSLVSTALWLTTVGSVCLLAFFVARRFPQ